MVEKTQLFKISEGPWEKLFEGKFQETHDILVYSNDKSVLLVLVLETEGKKTSGAVVELYKVFYAQGELESFVESLPRELLVLTRHSEKETLKFLLLASNPTYVEWKEEPFVEETDRLLKKIQTSSLIITDVSKAYDITLEELFSSKASVKKAFFSTPLLVPIVSTNYSAPESLAAEVPVSFHEFVVGMTRQHTKVVEPITLFSKTLVLNGLKEERRLGLQVLAEGYLLSSAPVVIFDFENEFEGLKQPTYETEMLKKYEIDSEPIGFPVRTFVPINDLKVDLSFVDPFAFAEVFGFAKSKCTEILANALMKNKPKTLSELSQKLSLSGEEFSEYDVKRTQRILSLLEKNYQGFFGGENPVSELATKKVKSLGRGSILNLSGLDQKARIILTHNILFGMLEYFKNEKQKGIKTLIVIPEAKNILNDHASPTMLKDLLSILSQFEKFGIGYALSSDSEIDFPQEIVNHSEAQIGFVQGNDCAIQLKGRKSYRVLLRPTLSSTRFERGRQTSSAQN